MFSYINAVVLCIIVKTPNRINSFAFFSTYIKVIPHVKISESKIPAKDY